MIINLDSGSARPEVRETAEHSTQHAIITLFDNITKLFDNGNIAISIFIELKKAFDTIDHRILLCKLYFYGIRGPMLKWMD